MNRVWGKAFVFIGLILMLGGTASWGAPPNNDASDGGGNSAGGTGALSNTTGGAYNTATGFEALFNNTLGSNHTATGAYALFNATLGFNNTATGFEALFNTTTASYNTASGALALWSNTEGDFNTAAGVYALLNNTTGSNNTASGAYVMGTTASSNFPTTRRAFQQRIAGATDAFVTKLNRSGTALVYSTYLGGSNGELGIDIAVDKDGGAYVTGRTESPDCPITRRAFQQRIAGGIDAFVTKLNRSGTALVYSTYLGGSGDDIGEGIAVDKDGQAYVTGSTASSDFPTTRRAFQRAYAGGVEDAFVAKIGDHDDDHDDDHD